MLELHRLLYRPFMLTIMFLFILGKSVYFFNRNINPTQPKRDRPIAQICRQREHIVLPENWSDVLAQRTW